tara:strand:- start:185 stop:364 length:180 start_codon:yes stop_codon:yes gene_type:complete
MKEIEKRFWIVSGNGVFVTGYDQEEDAIKRVKQLVADAAAMGSDYGYRMELNPALKEDE